MTESALRETQSGVTIAVHVVPRASRTELAGLHGASLRIRVQAPPVEGAANKELLRFLARRLSVPASRIELLAGAGSRQKLILVRGATLATIIARLETPPE
ncbi:MAG TPA: DUF167 domain-containing protein [Anaerolineae bacterium]|nr:DUF167 domain-containing protein [Anaerolineae bacterium]